MPARKKIEPKGPPLFVGVMYLVELRHRDALQEAAKRYREATGGRGTASASRLLRELLDGWLEKGAPLPGAKS